MSTSPIFYADYTVLAYRVRGERYDTDDGELEFIDDFRDEYFSCLVLKLCTVPASLLIKAITIRRSRYLELHYTPQRWASDVHGFIRCRAVRGNHQEGEDQLSQCAQTQF